MSRGRTFPEDTTPSGSLQANVGMKGRLSRKLIKGPNHPSLLDKLREKIIRANERATNEKST